MPCEAELSSRARHSPAPIASQCVSSARLASFCPRVSSAMQKIDRRQCACFPSGRVSTAVHHERLAAPLHLAVPGDFGGMHPCDASPSCGRRGHNFRPPDRRTKQRSGPHSDAWQGRPADGGSRDALLRDYDAAGRTPGRRRCAPPEYPSWHGRNTSHSAKCSVWPDRRGRMGCLPDPGSAQARRGGSRPLKPALRLFVGQPGHHGFDLAIGHVLGVGVHDVIGAHQGAEILELLLQIVGMLAGKAGKLAIPSP